MDILVAFKRAGFLTQQLNWVWEVTKEILSQGSATGPKARLAGAGEVFGRPPPPLELLLASEVFLHIVAGL